MIKYRNTEITINESVITFIDELVKKQLTLNDEIEKSDTIYQNINNNYYNQKKYGNFGHQDIKTMKPLIEEIVNNTSKPREYTEDLKNSYLYLTITCDKYNREYMNPGVSWESDWMTENGLDTEKDSKLIELLFNFIYDWSTDENQKPSKLDDLLEIYNLNR